MEWVVCEDERVNYESMIIQTTKVVPTDEISFSVDTFA